MKILTISLSFLFLSFGLLSAQDAKDYYKDAKKAVSNYDMGGQNVDDLQKAETAIQQAIEMVSDFEKNKDQVAVYLEAGKIFGRMGEFDVKRVVMDPAYQLQFPMAPIRSYEYYSKAYEMAEKGFQQRDAIDGLAANVNALNNTASTAYEEQRHEDAYMAFNAILKTDDLLQQEGKSAFQKESLKGEIAFATALSAMLAEKNQAAEKILLELKEGGSQRAEVWEYLYRINEESNPEKALSYLEEGRKKFPEDKGLLYAEINYSLKAGELEGLIDKLKDAIASEPDNVSLHNTLGFVYDNLFQKEMDAGNKEKADEYFQKALEKYNESLEVDPEGVDASYSLGALYYNKAAELTKEMSALESDLSKEGMKKFEALREEILGLFDKALPYFQRAESLNPNDMNTIIALKEIYAKRGTEEDLKISNEFKMRLETLQKGEQNESSYFNK